MSQPQRGPRLKAHIANVAAGLFYSEGIHKVGVDRVADKAGVTKRTLYHHFPSKDALLAEALRAAPIALFPKEGLPLARIRGAFASLKTYLKDTAFRGCPYILYSAELTDRHHPARQLIERRILKRRQWFQARLLEAGAPSPAPLAEELDVLFDGALASSVKRGTLEPVHAASRALERVLAGVKP
ncbi:MAG: TetR/AcrR family transcriptional regulator [Candidatus Eremiobacteraeota bacterium]|nr:TetR/AcrR family transcriptional regulator [Candidatus Eremiobacteraeota bacterium]